MVKVKMLLHHVLPLLGCDDFHFFFKMFMFVVLLRP